jgi:hypothetical protein
MPTDLTGYPDDFAALLKLYNDEVKALMDRLASNSITSTAWRSEMAAMLSRYAQAARMLGADLLSLAPADITELSSWLDEQLKYLDGFETVIKTAEDYNTAWLPRAEMYGASTYTQYWEGKVGDLPLPAMPAQGTNCKSGCKCGWDIQWISRENGDADAYWRLDQSAQHCQTCLTRSEMWNPVRVRNGDLQE